MKNFLNFLVFSLLAFLLMSWGNNNSVVIIGQNNNIVEVADSVPQRLENTLLWELSGKGIKKPSYIFGTIHMISAADFTLSEPTLKAIKKTKKMFFEIDMSQMIAISMKMMVMAPMRDGKKLSELLSEEDYELVKAYFTKETKSTEARAMPFSMVENWKPMLLQSFLYQDMIEGQVKAYEMELLTLGQAQKKNFGGLETIEDQISVFEKIPYIDQAKGLVELIKEIKAGGDAGKSQFQELIRLYRSEDIDGMVEMTGAQFDEMENAGDELLLKRNTKWIPKIIAAAKEQPCFFAVGAAHLGGPDGVIRLLMKEGYKLRPIK